MPRECGNGHVVGEDYLKACPRCGSHVSVPAEHPKAPPLAPATEEPVSVPLLLPFAAGGLVLVLFGAVLSYAAERGLAEVFGWTLVGAGVVVALVGVVDGARRRRAAG